MDLLVLDVQWALDLCRRSPTESAEILGVHDGALHPPGWRELGDLRTQRWPLTPMWATAPLLKTVVLTGSMVRRATVRAFSVTTARSRVQRQDFFLNREEETS